MRLSSAFRLFNISVLRVSVLRTVGLREITAPEERGKSLQILGRLRLGFPCSKRPAPENQPARVQFDRGPLAEFQGRFVDLLSPKPLTADVIEVARVMLEMKGLNEQKLRGEWKRR